MERRDMIVAGFGFRGDAHVESLRSALGGAEVEAVATVDIKAQTEVFRAFSANMRLPVIEVLPDALRAQDTRSQSQHSIDTYGTGSVAEAAALAAAGKNARLLGPRRVSDDHMATCALAEGDGT